MKIVIAPDSFKESLSADGVARAIEKGIRKVFKNAEIVRVPMADGGEGTMRTLVQSLRGKTMGTEATDPLGKKMRACWGWIPDSKTAIIEMAEASGLSLVPAARRNPMFTSSLGTGQLIRKALDSGARTVLLTLGGVATNDAGVGFAAALGYRFLDSRGRLVPGGVQGLERLAKIDASRLHPSLRKTKFVAACDVKNSLCGPRGSAKVYGPQKGATPSMIPRIDRALDRFAKIVKRDLKKSVRDVPGAGAAGGAGAGAIAFLNAALKPGIEIVTEILDLRKKMKGANLVITGEGKIDSQTKFGKTPFGVAKVAREQKIPVIAFCGMLDATPRELKTIGIRAAYPLVRREIDRQHSLKNAANLLALRVEQELSLYA